MQIITGSTKGLCGLLEPYMQIAGEWSDFLTSETIDQISHCTLYHDTSRKAQFIVQASQCPGPVSTPYGHNQSRTQLLVKYSTNHHCVTVGHNADFYCQSTMIVTSYSALHLQIRYSVG